MAFACAPAGALRLQADHPSRPGGTLAGLALAELSRHRRIFWPVNRSDPIDRERYPHPLETAYLPNRWRLWRSSRWQGSRRWRAISMKAPNRCCRMPAWTAALLDPTGLSTVRTRHDLTGPSAESVLCQPAFHRPARRHQLYADAKTRMAWIGAKAAGTGGIGAGDRKRD